MYSSIPRYLSLLEKQGNTGVLKQIRHGIEKEGLRVTRAGNVAQSAHPKGLGSTLTHPYITTDYSEALLEFITPVFQNINSMLSFLEELHCCSVQHINDEVIWASSMPSRLQGDDSIPIAEYGSSNIGKMKHVYRLGLAHRYGRSMQAIAGIHYNFSLSEKLWGALKEDNPVLDASSGYMGLIRNFTRYSWLLMYLFGASPVVDKTFLPDGNSTLKHLSDDTLFLPWAVSLRMSDIGYTNQVQQNLNICSNSLETYTASLSEAMHTPYKPYEISGIKQGDRYIQLNTNILQIENEYYSTIRPKRVSRSGEKPLEALNEHGIEYVEVRCLDINPLLPLGLDENTAFFMDTFLAFCALESSPEINKSEHDSIRFNFQKTVKEGRKPGLMLQSFSNGQLRAVSLKNQGNEVINAMLPVAEILDTVNQTTGYTKSLADQKAKLDNADMTPSAQVLNLVRENNGSFLETMLHRSSIYHDAFKQKPLSRHRRNYFDHLAEQSGKDQKKLESAKHVSFDAFLADYFMPQKKTESVE